MVCLKCIKSTLLKTYLGDYFVYVNIYCKPWFFLYFNRLPNPMNMDQVIDDYFVINAFCHINHKAHEYQSAITLSLSS